MHAVLIGTLLHVVWHGCLTTVRGQTWQVVSESFFLSDKDKKRAMKIKSLRCTLRVEAYSSTT